MQKLEPRDTYTPTNAPQVRGNCDLALNREETLSVSSLKTDPNTSEVDKPGHREQDLRVPVYVLNMRGQPLMPTTPGKAKRLLKQGKAKVVKRIPFTIQLKYATGETKQPIRLGIDSGYSAIGFSAVSGKKELIAGEVAVRMDIHQKQTERRANRRNRRNKLWYRESRFQNRKKTESLVPSTRHKLQTHLNLIDKLKKILPITRVAIEVASFDTQKIVHPEITGIEYQQGELQGYEIREYLLEKYQKKGSMTAEEFSHPEVQEHAKQSLKAAAFMNSIRWMLVNLLNCDHTYGYITKHNRHTQY